MRIAVAGTGYVGLPIAVLLAQHHEVKAVEAVIKLVMAVNPDAVMIIKSTVPVAYTAAIREKLGNRKFLFSPELISSILAICSEGIKHDERI